MTITFTHTLRDGTTVNITARVVDTSIVSDYSATARVLRHGVEREVLLAERGSAFDREVVPAILNRARFAEMVDDTDTDDDLDGEV